MVQSKRKKRKNKRTKTVSRNQKSQEAKPVFSGLDVPSCEPTSRLKKESSLEELCNGWNPGVVEE